jgi:hypothetical protein
VEAEVDPCTGPAGFGRIPGASRSNMGYFLRLMGLDAWPQMVGCMLGAMQSSTSWVMAS